MTNSSPFKPALRRWILPEEYWQMVDWHKSRSLCDRDLLTLDPAQIHDRRDELKSAEERDGFVFEGELQWLTDFLSADQPPSSPIYGEWVYWVLANRFLDLPLLWGAYEDSNGYVTPKYRDVWAGEVHEIQRHLPRFEHELGNELTSWLCERGENSFGNERYRIAVRGSKTGPSLKHLKSLFEKIHNLPYYFAEDMDYLTESCSSFTGLSVIDPDDPQKWEMDLDSEYTDWWVARFDGRRLIDDEGWTSTTTPDVQELFRQHLSPETCPNFDKLMTGSKEFRRLVFQNLHRLPQPVQEQVISILWDRVVLSPQGEIQTKATLLISCPDCQLEQGIQLDFEWGINSNYPEYNLGDEIRWGRFNVGNPAHPIVYVYGQDIDGCQNCGKEVNTLIKIANNRIESLAPDRFPEIRYDFQSPFVTEELIPLEYYEPEWCKQLFVERMNAENCYGYELLDWAFDTRDEEQPGSFSHWRLAVKSWLFYRNRHLLTEQEYLRIMVFLERPFLCRDDRRFTKDTPLKSCAILHDTKHGVPIDAWFAWGSLVNFPEYRIGDPIQWSDYSMGEPEIGDADVLGRRLRGGSFLKLEIRNNRIANVVGAPKEWGREYKAYVNGRPYLLWPDRDFYYY